MAAAAAAYDQHHPQGPTTHEYDKPASSASPPPSTAAAASAASELFTCLVCQKGFEKRTSRDRHTRRCRKKRPEDIIPRKKSCTHCANSKARCDQRRPQCTRCRSKGLSGCEYAYQQPHPEPPAQSQPHNIDLAFTDTMLLGDVDMNLSSDLFGWVSCPPSQHTPQQQQQQQQQQQLAHRRSTGSACLFPTSSSDSLHLSTPSLTVGHSSSSDSPTPNSSAYDFDLITTNLPTADDHCSPLSQHTAIIPRPHQALPHSAYPQVEFVSRLLCAFPALLKKPNTAPPFIHRTRLLPGQRSEPLANITALVHLSSVKSADNKTFVASCMETEWQRLEKAIVTATSASASTDSWAILEYYQALVVISLVKLIEGDLELKYIHTLENCAARIGFEGMFVEQDDPTRGEDVWQSWLLLESKRRTFVTHYLIDRVFHYRNGMLPMACDGMSQVQLPSARGVWEAQNAEDWEEESQNARSLPGWEGKKTEWITLEELWIGSPRMPAFYAGIDMLSTALMADTVVHTGEGYKNHVNRGECN
ncbi:hypothetical protein FN846DRAFT_780365 [Sphaerosporella brunnea]|uniref:Zn(2)-C6 fungal-type domain-containing protein n=1 Tax=Sphaerosporella brunnea TaxID=1250544 RepID=A0A5J5EUS8_9PEZI|nr:hypothetical protein FN846DRAFT_780365 [Sphaerosporella brunnea]